MVPIVRNRWQARRSLKFRLVLGLVLIQVCATIYQGYWLYHEGLLMDELEGNKGMVVTKFVGKPYLGIQLQYLNPYDKKLWTYLLHNHIFPPPLVTANFSHAKIGRADGHAVHNSLVKLFRRKRNGYFVEVGAYDGLFSGTILLERDYNWTGLLIECNPMAFPLLVAARRNALSSDVCVSRNSNAVVANITSIRNLPKLDGFGQRRKPLLKTFETQTFPFVSVLLALELKMDTIDLIVWNAQGSDFAVLKKFDFGIILVRVWVIDMIFFKDHAKFGLFKIMKENGYARVEAFRNYYMFVHETMRIPETQFRFLQT